MASKREWTIEDFEEWSAARTTLKEVDRIAEEEGGPRVSLVPIPHSAPLDFLPDEVDAPVAATAPADADADAEAGAVAFEPQPSRKTGGWSADRQREFIQALAEGGTIHVAAHTSGLSARSAYGLRVRSPAFAAAWDTAQQLAVGRLSALAFDRAIHGRIEQVYRDGDLVAERRVPNDRLLMWLLARLDPKRFAAPWERAKDDAADPQADGQAAFPRLLGALTDVAEEVVLVPAIDVPAIEVPAVEVPAVEAPAVEVGATPR